MLCDRILRQLDTATFRELRRFAERKQLPKKEFQKLQNNKGNLKVSTEHESRTHAFEND